MSALSDALNEANVEGWSARDIARRGDDRIHFATIAKYLSGRHGRPGEDVLEVFSDVLHVPLPKLRELAHLPPGGDGPYLPPREANRLDPRQRKLVDELIRLLAETSTGEVVPDQGEPVQLSPFIGWNPAGDASPDLVAKMPDGKWVVVEVKQADRSAAEGVRQVIDYVYAHHLPVEVQLTNLNRFIATDAEVDHVTLTTFFAELDRFRTEPAMATTSAESAGQTDEERAAELGLSVVREGLLRGAERAAERDEDHENGVTGDGQTG